MDLKDLRGRLTLVLTPELRQLALDELRRVDVVVDELDTLVAWFQAQETPDGYVLDAAASESEATMIDVILQAILSLYLPTDDADDLDDADRQAEEAVRTISRY